MALSISVKTIPHDQHQYETVGDWEFDKHGNLTIFVSDMKDWRLEAAVAVHEIVEALLCRDRKISEPDVCAFDIAFEKNRPEGNTEEPGDDPSAPYRDEHCFATGIEKMLISAFRLSWKEYDDVVMSL